RAFDNAGAVLGPLLAAALLGFLEVPLRTVFLLSAVPGLLGVFVLVRFVKEMPREKTTPAGQKLAPLPPGFWKALVPMGLFALAASSDTFLLLRAREVGFAAAALPLLWAFSNAIRSALGHWGGGLSDRIGRRRTLLLAFCLYAATYAAFAYVGQRAVFVLVLALYSVHAALSEGAEKALVASLVPPESRGRAFGLFHGLTAFCALPASVAFGWLFERVSSRSAYLTGAALATLAALSLLALVRSEACRDPSGNA
ncbi:MAG: MFS transporter, partial [Acidobacteria bacterium]|nr:MFS transporter [Acidobacteriota bacterium]